MPRPGSFTLEKNQVPIVHEAVWAPGPFWRDAEKLAPTGIRFPDYPARSESLYRLSYPGPTVQIEGDIEIRGRGSVECILVARGRASLGML